MLALVTDGTLLRLYDHGLRGGAIVLLLLMAALLLRDHARALAARLGAAFAVGVAAYVICSSQDFVSHVTLWYMPVLALCLGNSVVFWLLARALFDDAFALRRYYAAIWAGPVALGFVEVFLLLPTRSPAAEPIGVILTLASLAFAALAVAQSAAGWRTDLVERRRRVRVFVVGATAAYIAVIGVSELIFRTGPVPLLATAANAAGLVALSAATGWSLLRASGGDLFPAPPLASAKPPATEGPALDDRRPTDRTEHDAKLLAAIGRLMTVERAYRQEGLTIGSLSLKLGVPEYRLRRAINQGLGYRNFAGFLNRYRIEDAKAALADPAQAEVPILTIALDAGFQSLPPFNRAFKAETGLTPSDYRRDRLGKRPT
jgi:AraC-like DNA-binding protein